METPKTQHARSADGTFIAYQVFGDGPDLLIAFPWISHLELFWEDPDVGGWLREIARFARVITMDQRGTGLSDRMTQIIDLETKVDDVRAVLDAAGSDRATLYGQGVDGGAICAMFGATYPERTVGLIFWTSMTSGSAGFTESENQRFIEMIAETWGDEETSEQLMREAGVVSILDDATARRRWARLMRNAASPGDAMIHERVFDETDFRSILPAIHVPTTILQPAWDDGSVTDGERMASQIPGAKLVSLPDRKDFPPYLGDTDINIHALKAFLDEVHATEAELDRVLATVLFTDIVDSTAELSRRGDAAWRELLERHNSLIRALIVRHRGIEVDTAGDGFFVRFDGPGRAVRCARAIVDGVDDLGIRIRAGVHTGEVELEGSDARGIAVHIGSRVRSLASSGEVLVSSTVKDLVAGSGLNFENAGEHELKGVPDRWQLFRVVA